MARRLNLKIIIDIKYNHLRMQLFISPKLCPITTYLVFDIFLAIFLYYKDYKEVTE